MSMILNGYNLKFAIVMFVVYSYSCFFSEWNWYIMYILNIVQKTN